MSSPRGVDRRRFLLRAVQGASGATLAASGLGGLVGRSSVDLTGTRPIATTPFPHVISRGEWGADESIRRGPTEFAPLQKIVIHHTATAEGETDPGQRVRAIYRQHVQANGWNDIAYHFVVAPDGRIFEGRWARDYGPGEAHTGEDPSGHLVVGAHALDHNRGTMGVALLGTFTSAQPTPAAIESVAKLLAFVCDRHRLDPFDVGPYTNAAGATVNLPTILGHRDVRSTACPGDRLYGAIQDIRSKVAQTIARGFIGYRLVAADGTATHFGGARDYGDMRSTGVVARVVAAAGVPDAQGYWLTDGNGAVYSFGAAGFHGSLPGLRQSGRRIGVAPVVGISATPTGAGYWLYDDGGGIFSFGDAGFFGSVPALRQAGTPVGPAKIVAMVPTPSGGGYWVADEFGGVFAFGDAGWFGSLPDLRRQGRRIGTNRIVSMAATPSGGGYLLCDQFGGVFAFGDAGFFGSIPAVGIFDPPARRIVASPSGAGYVVTTGSGAVYAFGDAPFYGRWVAPGLDVVDLAPVIRRR